MKKIVFINYFICLSSGSEVVESVKSVNVTLIDQYSMKCTSIQEIKDTNDSLESQIDKKVIVLQPPSSSDTPE